VAQQPARLPTTVPHRKRTIAVTGSASGIGAAVRSRFERSGARVVGVDLHDAEVVGDLAQGAERARVVAELAGLTDSRLDAVVICAGLGPQVRPHDRIARVNFFGAVGVLDAVLPLLEAGDAPAAVVISSNAAGLTPPDPSLVDRLLAGDEEGAAARAVELDGATVYGTSKLALTRAVRRRAGRWGKVGVRLNAVAPGPVDTPLLQGGLDDPVLGPLIEGLPVPLGRRARAAEIAGAVAFLLDPTHGYVHGAVLFVDGGSDALLRPDAL
jgi:NAD(P)-dependent dehydrogenase (short-subunit alcohol dehydrogenase family)